MTRIPPALRAAALIVAAGALAACVPQTSLPDDCDAAAVSRQATLVEERMEPAALEVCRDQEVTITFTIQRDAVLHIHGYDDQAPAREVRSGETVELTLDTVRSGQFPIAIHTTDGPAEATAGTLVVHEP
ncbi:MAG: hypothetical protein ACRDHD_01210 [Candidatus Limnocylindria bacterium]